MLLLFSASSHPSFLTKPFQPHKVLSSLSLYLPEVLTVWSTDWHLTDFLFIIFRSLISNSLSSLRTETFAQEHEECPGLRYTWMPIWDPSWIARPPLQSYISGLSLSASSGPCKGQTGWYMWKTAQVPGTYKFSRCDRSEAGALACTTPNVRNFLQWKQKKRKQVQSPGFGLEDWIPGPWTKDSLHSYSSIPFKRGGTGTQCYI